MYRKKGLFLNNHAYQNSYGLRFVSSRIVMKGFTYLSTLSSTLLLITKNRSMTIKKKQPLSAQGLHHGKSERKYCMATLRFEASLVSSTLSAPKPKHVDHAALRNFFSMSEHLSQLSVGRGNMKVIKPSKPFDRLSLVSRWKEESKYFNEDFSYKETNEKNFASLSVSTPFLVFTIMAQVIVGIQIIYSRPSSIDHPGYAPGFSPMYQLVLLEEHFRADGPPPLVWLFEKLATGQKNHTNHVLYELWAVESSERELSFVVRTKADISFIFPSVFLQFLPISKDFLEKLGNAALASSMKEDVTPGLVLFRQSYLDWLKSSQSRLPE